MATFSKRPGPDGRSVWQAMARKKGYQQQTRTFDTKAKAEVWARQIESEMDRGGYVPCTEAKTTSLREASERYVREITPRKVPSTQRRERGRALALAGLPLAARPLAAIRGKDGCNGRAAPAMADRDTIEQRGAVRVAGRCR